MKPAKRQLATQDPSLKNSPIAWEGEEESDALQADIPDEPACFFNDVEYAHGSVFPATGRVALRCDHGVWIATDTEDY